MITAAKLKTLSTFTADALSVALFHSGNKNALDMAFSDPKFLGLSNGNQFCYSVAHTVEDKSKRLKVFLTYDPTAGKVIASLS